MANRLARETSPYLLQHAENPVDWYPWGEEALGRARAEDLPILLSVGYSACHWCHVMERESFEDPDTAAYMNANFVCVKVDREERPDVDAIYMEAVQAFTGQGGWPMTVFLDPEGVPFYGGTYFPPDDSRGMPSFRMVMEAVLEAYRGQRDEIRERAATMVGRLEALAKIDPGAAPGAEQLEQAVTTLLSHGDPANGGFGRGAEVPAERRRWSCCCRRRRAAWSTSSAPSTRCSRAASTTSSAAASPATRSTRPGSSPTSRRCSTTTPCSPAPTCTAGRCSGTSATGGSAKRRSTGCCARCAGPRAASTRPTTPTRRARRASSTSGRRTRSGRCSPTPSRSSPTTASPRRATSRARTSSTSPTAPRRPRPPASTPPAPRCSPPAPSASRPASTTSASAPGTRWRSRRSPRRARCSAAPDYLDAAAACAEFILGSMRDEDGRLLRTYKDGRAHLNAYLEDHAFLVEALLTLYEASFDPRWFKEARALAESMIERFGDAERGGFFTTSTDHEELIARRKEVGDHPIPAGQSSAALGLLRLAALTGEARLRRARGRRLRPLRRADDQPPRLLRPPPAGARLPPRLDARGGARRPRLQRARGGRAGRVPPQRRRRRGPGGRGRTAAPRRPHRNRRRARRLRLRGLHLQPAGDRPGGASSGNSRTVV